MVGEEGNTLYVIVGESRGRVWEHNLHRAVYTFGRGTRSQALAIAES